METLIASEQKQAPIQAKKPSSLSFMVSITVFLLVLIGTIGTKVYVFALDKKLENLQAKMTEIETTISQTKTRNPEVNAYSLWDKAKKTIETQILKSQAQIYLTQLDSIARAFYRKVAFSGFNFSDGKVTTRAAAFGGSGDAALNVIELLRNYRGTPKVTDPLFSLNPVLSVSGDASRREFDITFITKAPSAIPAVSSGAVAPAISASWAVSQ